MDWAELPLLDIELANTTRLADGRTVEWEGIGSGEEPLVWVEGGPSLGAHLARADVVPVLDRFRCHLVNGPGNGRSSPPATSAGYGLEAFVGFLEAFRVGIGLGPVTVMGHSWGGLVAPAWAALHPEGVRRLIVVDGYAGAGSVDAAAAEDEQRRALDRLRDRPWFADGWAGWQRELVTPHSTEIESVAAMRAFMPFYFASPEDPVSAAHIERLRRELRINVDAGEAWSGWREAMDYRPLFAEIRCPTIVIVGEHDWLCGPVWNRSLAAAIPGARLVEFPGAAHLPQYEAPVAFRAAIDAWLADVG